jgi:type IV secretion system protein VirD4
MVATAARRPTTVAAPRRGTRHCPRRHGRHEAHAGPALAFRGRQRSPIQPRRIQRRGAFLAPTPAPPGDRRSPVLRYDPVELHAEIAAHRLASGGGSYLGRSRAGWCFSGAEHATLVLGPPRSGKSTAVVIPSVAAAGGAVVSTSTKPDIATATARIRQEIGPCLLFDPSGSAQPMPGVEPMHWSPLPACRQWDEALVLATTMVETARRTAGSAADGGHWTERAAALLAPLFHAAALEGADMASVLSWVDCRQAGRALAILDTADEPVAGDLLAGIAATDAREQSGIWSTASGALRAYRSRSALRTSSGPTVDVGQLLDEAATVYVCASGRHQAAVAPLVVGFLADLRAAIYRQAAAWEVAGRPDHAGPRRPDVLFALDELANIAPIPDLPAMVSEAGGQGLTVLACLQDLSQARRRWGPEADGLLSLFGTTVVFPGIGDVATLQALSTLAGEVDVRTRSVSGPSEQPPPASVVLQRLLFSRSAGWPGRRSATTTTVARRRLPVDAIAHGRPGQALVVDRRNQMRWLSVTPWYASEPWRTPLGPSPERAQAPMRPSSDRVVPTSRHPSVDPFPAPPAAGDLRPPRPSCELERDR